MSKVLKTISSVLVPKVPKISQKSAVLPDPNTFAARKAARDKVKERGRKNTGRGDTILSRNYSNSNLGGTN